MLALLLCFSRLKLLRLLTRATELSMTSLLHVLQRQVELQQLAQVLWRLQQQQQLRTRLVQPTLLSRQLKRATVMLVIQ